MYVAALDSTVPKTGSVMVPTIIFRLLAAWTELLTRLVTGRSKVFVPRYSMDSSGSIPLPRERSFSTHDVTANRTANVQNTTEKDLMGILFQ